MVIQIAAGKNIDQTIGDKYTRLSGEDLEIYKEYRKNYVTKLCGDDGKLERLNECDVERKLWEDLSNSFCKGTHEDLLIESLLINNELNEYGIEAELFLEFFLAKFKIKRGLSEDGIELLESVIEKCEENKSLTTDRLSCVANSNLLIVSNEIETPKQYLYDVNSHIEKISSLKQATAKYIAYESASLIGKGVTRLAGNRELSYDDILEMEFITNTHDGIMKEYNDSLQNQDVVNMSLKWFLNLQRIIRERKPNSIQIDELLENCKKGFQKSKEHCNNLFFLQSIIMLSIYYNYTGKEKMATITLDVCKQLMARLRVNENQEGVKELLMIIHNSVNKKLFKRVFKLGNQQYAEESYEIITQLPSIKNNIYRCNFFELIESTVT